MKLKGTDAYFDKYQLGLNKIVSYVQQKEIRRPITKASIQTNWKVIATEKEQGMGQIYYYKQVEDNQIEELINSLPFTILWQLVYPSNQVWQILQVGVACVVWQIKLDKD